jgi:transcriptional regulator GlxA family with amidase domain
MSVRTFSRRFRDEVGMTPGQWLARQRVDLARRLLETTDLPVDLVAERAGFGTSASLRQHLVASIGVPPSAYRHTFRAGHAHARAH